MANEKNYMYKSWWKILAVLLLVYTFVAGLLLKVPQLPVLQETIRNLYFHVCMWFAMMILFTVSVVNAIRYLRTLDLKYDIYTRQFAVVAIVFGILGYATGAIWASYTWADPNTSVYNSFSTIARDPKLIGAAIALIHRTGVVPIGEAAVVVAVSAWQAGPALSGRAIPETHQPNIVALGQLLYSRYLLPFELAGLILLVAMVGAIVLTHRRRGDLRTPKVSRQVRRRPRDSIRKTDPGVGEGVKL